MEANHAVLTTTAEVLARHGPVVEAFSETERVRSAAFLRSQDRDDFTAAHVLARVVTGAILHVPAASVTLRQTCPTCGGPHGPPSVDCEPQLKLSWSHCAGVVLAAASMTHAVGVDVEHRQSPPDSNLLAYVASAGELKALRSAVDEAGAFTQLWVRKEALVKLGLATLDTMAQLDLAAVPYAPWSGRGATSSVMYKGFVLEEFTSVRADVVACVASVGHMDLLVNSVLRAPVAS